MRQTMNPIATDNGRFKDGNPATGEYGTVVTADHMNNVQDAVISMQNEIITVLNQAGIEVNPADNTQLWQALQMIAGQVESIADLRWFEPVKDRQVAFLKSYYAGKSIGGGVFYADFADSTTADNAGTVIVTAGGKRWKRISENLSLHDFGYSESSNALFALNHAEQANLGQYIDCCGLTIDVGNTYPVNNKYTNGKFTINGVTVNAQYNQVRTGIGRFISGTNAAKNLQSREWTGNDVVVIGEGAMAEMEKCVSGIAIGKRAQGKSIISRDNVAIGADSLFMVQAETEWYSQDKPNGTRNVAIGGAAGRGITTGYSNVAIGRLAGQNLNSGGLNVALGAGAIGGTVPVGFSGDIEHYFPSKAKASVAVGANALNQYVANSECVAVGGYAAERMKKGLYNTALGFGALRNLEADIAPNGGEILWTGQETGTYSQEDNTITLNFSDLHGAEIGYIAGIRLLDGDAKTLMGDIVPAEVLTKNGNRITVASPKSLRTSGQAMLCFVYSTSTVSLNTNQNTAVGFAALNNATRANYSVALGTSAMKVGNNHSASVAVGAIAFEYGSHTNSVGIGRSVAGRANSTNSVIIGVNTLSNAANVTNSIILGNNVNPTSKEVANKLAIGSGISGDMSTHRYGVNIPVDSEPLASLHVRPKDSEGSGRTSPVDGLLVEHSGFAIAKLDGVAGSDLDFEQNGVVKFAIRYTASSGITTIITNNQHSWKIHPNHAWLPDADNRNSFGSAQRKLKEIYVTKPGKTETGDKAITASWFNEQFSQSLTSQNGWCRLPNGIIEQWGWLDMADNSNTVRVEFPIAFNECLFVIPIDITNGGGVSALSVKDKTNQGCVIVSPRYAGGVAWFARGK